VPSAPATRPATLATRVVNAVAARVASQLVSRFLRRFVRKVAGEEVAALRVALTGGALVLRDLDLNLSGTHAQLLLAACAARRPTACSDSEVSRARLLHCSGAELIPAGSVTVTRAYAAELRVVVPWGTLATDPLEVRVRTRLGLQLCPSCHGCVVSRRRWRCTVWTSS
jgi:hypothetical protein